MKLTCRGFEVKELDGQTGVFTGYASTWDQDLYGDVVVKGAFTSTLEQDFPDGGAHIPIHWQHQDNNPTDIIGETLSAVEDEHGLLVTARLDTDLPEGQRAYELLKRGLIHQMSIGFIPTQTVWVDQSAQSGDPFDGYREIREVKLFEISLVQVAANQGAEVLEVKSGRVLSAANEEKLRNALQSLNEVLDGVAADNGDAKKPDDTSEDSPDSTPDDGETSDDTTSGDTDKPKQDDTGKTKKAFAQWAKEYQEISDFFSLDH